MVARVRFKHASRANAPVICYQSSPVVSLLIFSVGIDVRGTRLFVEGRDKEVVYRCSSRWALYVPPKTVPGSLASRTALMMGWY